MNKKKFIAAATSALCLTSTLSVMPLAGVTNATEAVNNTFEITYEGWHGSDIDSDVIAVDGIGVDGSRGMLVTKRTSADAGAESSKGFYLWGGVKYDYSVMVKADTDEVFHISLMYKDEYTEEETTVELAKKSVKAGEWTNISSKFKAPENTYEYLIKITTESANDFVFDNVVVKTKEDTSALEAKAASSGLKDVFEGYGFRVGNIFNGGTIRNSAIQATILKDCNAIECENETKADAVLRQSGSTNTNINVSLDNCSAIADFCVQNNLAFRGHAFVWHSQTPAWFLKENFNGNGNWVTPSVMDQRLDSYIHNVFQAFETKYPTLNLYAYDVCNECVSDDSNRTKNNGGAREPGDNNQQGGKSAYVAVYGDNSFVEKAFTIARKYAPEGCKLYYNDYNEYWDHKRDCIINTILKPLSAKGVLDGMGMQSHVDAGHTSFSGTVNYLNAMDMYLSLGIDVQVTELDISIDNGQSLDDQAKKYENIVKHIVDVNTSGKYAGKVTLFQVWGPNDSNTWISGDKKPTLYDKSNNPKSAYTALMNYGSTLTHPGPIPSLDGGGEITPPEPDSDGYWFHHKFEGTDEGWSGRGAASVLTSGRLPYAGQEALLIQDREAEWNGAIFTLPGRVFKAGEEYSFSANVAYADGDLTRDFKFTLEYTDGSGETTWAEIASGTTGAGTYLQLANTNYKLPADGSNFKIILETTDGTLDNFYIDEIIGAPAGTKISGAGQPSLPKDPNKITPGDTDFDGKLTAIDMVNMRKAVLKQITDASVLKAADVDKSGAVEVNDLVLLQEFLLGKISEFPDNRPPFDYTELEAKFKGLSTSTSYKKDTENNPLYTQRFGADPGWMVYKDRLYVYTTNDAFEYKNGQLQENSYDVWTINCVSSADLVNWTDHGAIPVAGRRGATSGAAKWANNSWAPDAAWKTINGKDKFFLYFADNGSGIGVLTADSPTGPWTDPLGKQLISRSTPNCGNVAWLFDPGVYYDPETDKGYIAFGGGKNNDSGTYADPGTGRMAQLGDDMISIVGSAKTLNTPYLFEDSSLIKIGSNWIYSFCHNWNVPGGTSINGHSFGSADIGYMYGPDPMGTLTYGGACFKNTGTQRLDNGGNNHHSIIEFKGSYYVLYHSRQLEMRMGVNGGKGLNYRSPCIDKATVSGTSITCNGSQEGVSQIETLNPFTTVQAETMSNQSKDIVVNGLGDTTVSGKAGSWIKVSGVDLKSGVSSIKVNGKGNNAAVKFCVGSVDGDVIGYAPLDGTEVPSVNNTITGKKDIYIVFSGELELDNWSFS